MSGIKAKLETVDPKDAEVAIVIFARIDREPDIRLYGDLWSRQQFLVAMNYATEFLKGLCARTGEDGKPEAISSVTH